MRPKITLLLMVLFELSVALDVNGDILSRESGLSQLSSLNLVPSSGSDTCFRAAVFDFQAHLRSKDIERDARFNLYVMNQAARVASDQGAKVIVFPEDGIFIGNKSSMAPLLSGIPDPDELSDLNNNPCNQPNFFASSVLKRLSCIAKENNLYLAANFGTIQRCHPLTKVGNRTCPESGQFTLNTDVVFDSNGNFIKRYRKYNLFMEVFDHPPTLEEAYFDTPFGKFGIFTCFDLLFKRPAIDLVEKQHVDTILFPTYWYDELPFLTAIQMQDSWSFANKVNLIASNIHKRSSGSVGSGIYSGNNMAYTGSNSIKSQLIIANLPKKYSLESKCKPEVVSVDWESGLEEVDYQTFHYPLLTSDTIMPLRKLEDKITRCNGQVCCTVDYKLSTATPIENYMDKLVLIVRDGLRPGFFECYEQVCSIATLESPFNNEKLNTTRFAKQGIFEFDRLNLEGTFNSTNVFPIAARDVARLVDRRGRKFECNQISGGQNSCRFDYSMTNYDNTILTFGMYGRMYDKDNMPLGW